jgi:hypothetical protein
MNDAGIPELDRDQIRRSLDRMTGVLDDLGGDAAPAGEEWRFHFVRSLW